MFIKAHCHDGSDRNCTGTVIVELPYTGLTPFDVCSNWDKQHGALRLLSVAIWPSNIDDWIAVNAIWLSDFDIDELKTQAHFVIEYDDLPPHHCCGPCGSPETYVDGVNVTAT